MLKYFYYFIAIFFLYSCNQGKAKMHLLESKAFTMETPNKWKIVIDKGIDSYVGKIIIDSIDYLSFDYGLYSDNLEDYLMEQTDSTSWTEYPPLSQLGKNKKNKATFDLIDNRKAKIILPIISGQGATGIYFDSVSSINGTIIKLQISGTNLSPDNEKLVLIAFKTLRFKARK